MAKGITYILHLNKNNFKNRRQSQLPENETTTGEEVNIFKKLWNTPLYKDVNGLSRDTMSLNNEILLN